MQLLPLTTVGGVGTFVGSPFQVRQPPNSQGEAMAVQAQITFTFAAGGTSPTLGVYLQTSFDGGATWVDVGNSQFAGASGKTVFGVSSTTSMAAPIAATDGAQAVNTVTAGLVGSWWRVKYVVGGGAYSGATTLKVDAEPVMVPAGPGSFN